MTTIDHHERCPRLQVWDGDAEVPCTCPPGWPRRLKHCECCRRELPAQGLKWVQKGGQRLLVCRSERLCIEAAEKGMRP